MKCFKIRPSLRSGKFNTFKSGRIFERKSLLNIHRLMWKQFATTSSADENQILLRERERQSKHRCKSEEWKFSHSSKLEKILTRASNRYSCSSTWEGKTTSDMHTNESSAHFMSKKQRKMRRENNDKQIRCCSYFMQMFWVKHKTLIRGL